MELLDIRTLKVKDKSVLVREDFNVPMLNGEISDSTRIDAALPTLEYLKEQGANIMLIAHLGRPEVGDFSPATTLAPVASYISERLEMPVQLVNEISSLKPKAGHIVMLENVRCFAGEMDNSTELGEQLVSNADIFVFDAFACAHRAQASTHAAITAAKVAAAGPLLLEELGALEKAFSQPARPLVSVTGGAKVSTKLGMLKHLVTISDKIIIGGGMANTFLAAQGVNTAKSLVEESRLDEAKDILHLAMQENCEIILPDDVVVAESIISDDCQVVSTSSIPADLAIFDIGPSTRARCVEAINSAGTVLWNGPVGVFEQPFFSEGTKVVGKAISHHSGFTIAGGGDTLAAIKQFELYGFDLISTGGGAFLEWLEGRTLPAIAALQAAN